MSSPDIRIRVAQPASEKQSTGDGPHLAKPRSLLSSKVSKWGDRTFHALVLSAALSVLAVVTLVIYELHDQSQLSIHRFGWKFFTTGNWDPVNGDFGAAPFIYGTLVSSFLALLIAVPLGVGVAVFMTDMCPRPLRVVFSYLVELLAAVPSVIYGLWGIFVLVPVMKAYIQPFLKNRFAWTGFFDGPMYGIGMLPASVILAIMIVPFISSITREVILAVPQSQREAAMALGATRWETLRIAILRNARIGIAGGIVLA